MPFTQIDVNHEIEKRCADSQEFKKTWEEHQAEYRLIGEMIALRKKKKITQKELAALTGNKQQVISRIERKENIPSIKTFSNILEALGYELQIVKKAK
jgi:ribosome-binding protein aMBF1 (putative translation factor)